MISPQVRKIAKKHGLTDEQIDAYHDKSEKELIEYMKESILSEVTIVFKIVVALMVALAIYKVLL